MPPFNRVFFFFFPPELTAISLFPKGVVDMHSHSVLSEYPESQSTDDVNERDQAFRGVTPYLRAVNGFKTDDAAIPWILSGGVTSSLIIPGSANIMGGEGTVVKNVPPPADDDQLIEYMLLERGIPSSKRHRYMKMACGENPRRVYGHTRMGLSWLFRRHMDKARNLRERQDEYCAAARSLSNIKTGWRNQSPALSKVGSFITQYGIFPEDLEFESTVAMLRGRVALHNHCYTVGDMETMVKTSREFGFRIKAFHHAISAWLIPDLLKEYGNLTVATFAEMGLYKHESLKSNLFAAKILNDHDVPVAFKSDHGGDELAAKHLIYQAAVAHSFHLPMDKALQSITSVPARALDLGDRIGYVRQNYDADIVVWSGHPLSVGAAPIQVFVDGDVQIDEADVRRSIGDERLGHVSATESPAPGMKTFPSSAEKAGVCGNESSSVPPENAATTYIITGIKESFLKSLSPKSESTLVVADGKIQCFGPYERCVQKRSAEAEAEAAIKIDLSNGFIMPGLTAYSTAMGLVEMDSAPETWEGYADPKADFTDPDNIPFARYGLSLGKGKGALRTSFNRASLGGITRALSAPASSMGGLVQGVSVLFEVGGDRNLLADGAIKKDEVALHVSFGQEIKATYSSISIGINKFRKLLRQYRGRGSADGNVYDKVLAGVLPLVVNVDSLVSIQKSVSLFFFLDTK